MRRSPTTSLTVEPTLISVVVCTRNRCELLPMSIGSLCFLRTDPTFKFEIIVIDNGSCDETAAAISQFGKAHPQTPIRYVFEPKVGIVTARNRGISEACGSWIAFFDDDQIAEPDWLLQLFSFARERHLLFVGGQVQLKQLGAKQRQLGRLCRDLLSENTTPKPRPFDRRFMPSTGNLMVHRLALDTVGRFQTDFDNRGEDTLLFLKLEQFGFPGWYNPNAVVQHVIPELRLTDSAFLQLADFVGKRMPKLEKYQWRSLFPLVWAVRAGTLPCVLLPRYAAALLSQNADQILDAKCQLVMTALRVRHGISYLFSRSDQLFPEPLLK